MGFMSCALAASVPVAEVLSGFRASLATDCHAFVSKFHFQQPKDQIEMSKFERCMTTRRLYGNQTMAYLTGVHHPVTLTTAGKDEDPEYGNLIWALPTMDYVVSNFIRNHGTYSHNERDVLEFFLRKGDFYVDIGANVGSYVVPMAERVGDEGLVWAFEPFRLVRQILTANVAINGLSNVHIFDFGLGNKTDSVRCKYDGEEDVQIRTLDSLPMSRHIRLMKIDVEVNMTEVLHGARKALRKHRPILSIEADFPSDDDVYPILKQFHYTCKKAVPAHAVTLCVPPGHESAFQALRLPREGL
eukprot:GEMP01082830.1.p1 GENE.GEMP01082830.1~~GEMP01082830.1.p1  ORF type:complete len:313 (+),score=44.43 GEMP01082830.1:38-940(+)